jgi:hypothetical protein
MLNADSLRENAEIISACIAMLKKKSTDIEFGTCSLVLTFHSGKISKTEIQTAEAMKIAHKD